MHSPHLPTPRRFARPACSVTQNLSTPEPNCGGWWIGQPTTTASSTLHQSLPKPHSDQVSLTAKGSRKYLHRNSDSNPGCFVQVFWEERLRLYFQLIHHCELHLRSSWKFLSPTLTYQQDIPARKTSKIRMQLILFPPLQGYISPLWPHVQSLFCVSQTWAQSGGFLLTTNGNKGINWIYPHPVTVTRFPGLLHLFVRNPYKPITTESLQALDPCSLQIWPPAAVKGAKKWKGFDLQ